MKKINVYLLVLMLCMEFMFTGCHAQPSAAQDADHAKTIKKSQTIAFVPGLIQDAFYISMNRGLQKKAKEYGMTVLFQGATEWDDIKQTSIIESMIDKKVDMLITAPTNDETMIAPLKKCVEAGIPVITVDTNIKDESFLVANITSDNLQGGKAAAEALAKLIGYKGEVAVINTKSGITTSDARANGFEEGLKAYPDIKLVSEQYCNNQAEKAAAQIQEILLEHPKLAGAFGCNLFSAIGTAHGLKAKGAKIPVVCYDAGQTEIDNLKKGEIAATVVQKPMAIGEIAGDYAYYFFNNQKDKIVKNTLVPSIVTTRENMNDPEISKWFYTMD